MALRRKYSKLDQILNASAPRSANQLILEGIVTTENADGSVNVAPMGPVVDRTITTIRLRPFQTSTTYQNLRRNGTGVFHVTDDVKMLALAAIGDLPLPPLRYEADCSGHIIEDACRWFAFEVVSLDDSQQRVEIECEVRNSGQLRPFFGWNRAMHSVLEAAILATRAGMLSMDEIRHQLKPLRIIVDKTASQHEREAFKIVENYLSSYHDT